MFAIILFILLGLSFEANVYDIEGQLLLAPYPKNVSYNKNSPDSITLYKTIQLSVSNNCNSTCLKFLKNNFNHSITFPLERQEGLDNFRISLHKVIDLKQTTINTLSTITIVKVELTSEIPLPKLKIGIDESYQLNISKFGIVITSPNCYGARHAFETLIQLIKMNGKGFVISQIPITINDEPRFKWRGLMIDPSRNLILPSEVYKVIDGLALVKANMLHIHLSDCQTFVFECKKFPNLSKKGTYEKDYVFTHEKIKELSDYGRTRGVILYGEIDLPGHTAALDLGYKGVVADYWQNVGRRSTSYGENSLALNPADPRTFPIIESLVTELGESFENDYVHIGGDEVSQRAWSGSKDYENIKLWMAEKNMTSLSDVERYFNFFAIDKIVSNGKIPVVWEEVFRKRPDKNTIIQVWNDPSQIRNIVNNGYKTIFSGGFYLDRHMPTCVGSNRKGCSNNHWMWVWTNRDMYEIDPVKDLSEKEKEGVLGGEGCSWGESADQENLFDRVFQRYTAIAERLWSQEDIVDPKSHEVRANYIRCLALRRDIYHCGPLYHSYCQLPWKSGKGYYNNPSEF